MMTPEVGELAELVAAVVLEELFGVLVEAVEVLVAGVAVLLETGAMG